MAVLIIFLLGLFVGSFLNVIIDRLPRGESFWRGRSYCESCKHVLSAIDLIPLFSFISLKGRCRYCKVRLSYQYPLLEGLTGMAFATTYFFASPAPILYMFFAILITAILILIFFIDLFEGIIPFVIVIPGIVLSILFTVFTGGLGLFIVQLLTALIASGFFLLLFLITRGKGMGFGDVVYVFFMGMLLGFPGTTIGLYIAFLTGGIISLILILLRRKKFRGSTIPFGPFLVLGTYITYLWGNTLTDYTLRFLL